MGRSHWLDLIVIGLILFVPRRIFGRSVIRRFLEGTPTEADPLRQTFILANAVTLSLAGIILAAKIRNG